jgi:hypothetical protein
MPNAAVTFTPQITLLIVYEADGKGKPRSSGPWQLVPVDCFGPEDSFADRALGELAALVGILLPWIFTFAS